MRATKAAAAAKAARPVDLETRLTDEHHQALKLWLRLLSCTNLVEAETIKLTPSGRALFARMAAVHEQWVIELFSGLSAAEKGQVHRLLAKLKLHLAGVAAGSE